jgi:Tol biopolymer transport system component
MKSMVYLQNSELHDDIFVADSLNKNPINLTNSPSIRDGWPVFSYDNQWVYYSAMDNGTFCIYRVRPDGSDKTKLTSAPAGNEDARVSLSRQGDNMIFNRRYNKTIEIRGLKFS